MSTRRTAQRRRVVPQHISVQAERYVAITDPLATFLFAHGELAPARACCFALWRSQRVPSECNRALKDNEGAGDRQGLRIVGRRLAAAGLLSLWSKRRKRLETTVKREAYFGLYLCPRWGRGRARR